MCGRGVSLGRAEGRMRVSVGAHASRASIASPLPTTDPSPLSLEGGDPYACLTHPGVERAQRPFSPAAFVSPLSASALEGGVLPPPSPPCCAHGCNCAPSSGSASSVGACRIHERLFACPPPPLPVTSGSTDHAHFFAGGDGEVAVAGGDEEEVWAARDDTSEDLKEESVKELLISKGWKHDISTYRGVVPANSRLSFSVSLLDQLNESGRRVRAITGSKIGTPPCSRLEKCIKQVSTMSLNLSAKIDEIQCHQHADTSAALHAIRTQLQDLTKSVESCQSEVVEVKRDMVEIKQEIETLQAAKEEIEELRNAVDQLEEQHRRRKLKLIEQ